MLEPVGDHVAAAALGWVGTPFRWEASLKGVGVDCRGVLSGVARECGLPEAAEIEARVVGYSRRINEAALMAGLDRLFDRQPGLNDLRPGDVLGFRIQRKLQHLGIYTGDGTSHRMVHAYSGDPAQVIEAPLGRFWMGRLAGVWRWRVPEGQGGN